MRKPEACKGCPLYGDGCGFVPDKDNGSEVTINLSMPNLTEVQIGQSGLGQPFGEIADGYLPLLGQDSVNISHSVRCLQQKRKRTGEVYGVPFAADFFKSKAGRAAVDHCRVHDSEPVHSGHILALGEASFAKFGGQCDSLQNWRGFTTPEHPKVMLTYDLSFLRAAPKFRLAVKNDFRRFRQLVQGQYPLPIPRMVQWGDPHFEVSFAELMNAPYVVLDTEYQYDPEKTRSWDRATRLDLIGLYSTGLDVVQIDLNALLVSERAWCTELLRRMIKKTTMVFQNTGADVLVLDKFLGIKWEEYKETHDTMYAHAALWPEQPHRLEFLASLYGRMAKLKHLAETDPLLYNAGDVVETAYAWEALEKELRGDPRSARVYTDYMLPLRPIILHREKTGIRVDQSFVGKAKVTLQAKADFATSVGEAYAGFPLNLNSSAQLISLMVGENVKVKSFKADILNPLRSKYLTVDPREDLTPENLAERIEDGAHPILEARAAFIQSDKQLSAYINPLIKADGSIEPRVYPNFLPTAQDNGRHSTTNPPLAQLPESLRKLLIPDAGRPWFGYDWSAIELRIVACMANDRMLLDAFENDHDMHTIHCCQIFGYDLPANLVNPHGSDEDAEWRERLKWEGKDDKRRVFAKTFLYRTLYGGDPNGAGGLPGANKLGVKGAELVAGAHRWLAAHPDIVEFHRRLRGDALEKGEVRSFLGRRRRLAETDLARRTRQAYDFPPQGGCSDIYNDTIIKVTSTYPDTSWVWGMHDSLYFEVPLEHLRERAFGIKEIAQREFDIFGTPMRFTISGDIYLAPEDKGTDISWYEDGL